MNVIEYNYAYQVGGGILCYEDGNPHIYQNTISHNWTSSSEGSGGGIHVGLSDPVIEENIIAHNHGKDYGGGVTFNYYSNGQLLNNEIYGNYIQTYDATNGGGGVCIWAQCNTSVIGNTIHDNYVNSTTGRGGGIYWHSSSVPSIQKNLIYNNNAHYGGGIYGLGSFSGVQITNNTIALNSATNGGGIYLEYTHPCIANCIVWNNTPDQILLLTAHPSIIYSDISGGWPGVGNISEDPLFINPSAYDFSLQSGSPCINAGDPASPLDPDGTCADMGAIYYDLSGIPGVEVTLQPDSLSIQIPASGGSFDYHAVITNISAYPQTCNAWIMQCTPSGTWQGPMLEPVFLILPAGAQLEPQRTQTVPGSALPGTYLYCGYVGMYPSVKWDSSYFEYTKLTTGDGPWISDWACTGEPFPGETQNNFILPPSSFILSASPNPFNPSTTIAIALPEAARVHLAIYDLSGRLVSDLISGWRDAGAHEVTFDASGLPSGLYFARLVAGDIAQTRKLVLLK